MSKATFSSTLSRVAFEEVSPTHASAHRPTASTTLRNTLSSSTSRATIFFSFFGDGGGPTKS
eukprot:CAMPEP_0198672420 /NCGR_PEP_ID=MMETSP1467-20131203/91059_1 /TAXON_ID=1462469 /ORGANISM="unid. sp., Strain CCMP2135" /LENGTH=61 /DNA_ID=CAMNT_0044409255 /DNA_START=23 /DNA_END=205 /DNA_ORIENTATION=-